MLLDYVGLGQIVDRIRPVACTGTLSTVLQEAGLQRGAGTVISSQEV